MINIAETANKITDKLIWVELFDIEKKFDDLEEEISQNKKPGNHKENFDENPDKKLKIANLSPDQTANFKEKIWHRESSGNYEAENQFGYIGKYQFWILALMDLGYIDKNAAKMNAAMNNPENRTGKNGIKNKKNFLKNPEEQEIAMTEFSNQNYKTLKKQKIIDENSSPAEVWGFLAVAHLLGPGGAKKFKNGVNTADANGTTAQKYFEIWKSALDQPLA